MYLPIENYIGDFRASHDSFFFGGGGGNCWYASFMGWFRRKFASPSPKGKKATCERQSFGAEPTCVRKWPNEQELVAWKRRSQYLTKLWYFTNHQPGFPWNNKFPLLNYLLKGEVRWGEVRWCPTGKSTVPIGWSSQICWMSVYQKVIIIFASGCKLGSTKNLFGA